MNYRSVVSNFRRKYGDCYLTVLENGLEIPWKRLSLGRFLYYQRMSESGQYSIAHVEDEVFKECVLDPNLISGMEHFAAGTISTVVRQISVASGPSNAEEIQRDLDIGRYRASGFFQEAAGVICQIFPSYKIDDLLSLDYERFMEVLGIAERRALQSGLIQEPISVTSADGEEVQRPSEPQRPAPKPSKPVEYKNLNPDIPKPPKPSSKKDEQIVTSNDVKESQLAMTGHEAWDGAAYGAEEIEQMRVIYKDYFDMQARGEKITPQTIKDHRGTSREEVQQHYKEYKKKLDDGTIQPNRPDSPKPKKGKKKKIVVKRLN